MSSGDSKKSRRRFLADLLFLGGGLSAAALLAQSRTGAADPAPRPTPRQTPATACTKSPDQPPDIAGEMIAPEPVNTPLPAYDGDYVAPEPPRSKGEMEVPLAGKPVAPPPQERP